MNANRNVRKWIGPALAGAAFFLVGCAHSVSTDVAELQQQVQQQAAEIQSLQATTEQKDEEISRYKAELDAQSRQARVDLEAARASGVDAPLLPPQARPGECYARVFVPPAYRSVTEQVLKKEASERIETLPAKYEWVEEKVLVKEAGKRLVEVPAQYEWREERVMTRTGSSRPEEVPARYETREEKVLVEPAHTTWKKGRGLIERVDNTTGEIMCLVEVPATYKTVRKRVLVSPATVREVPVPASYETVRKRVLVREAAVKEVVIPAEYKTIKVKKLVAEPQTRRIPVPAEYQTLTRTEKVGEGRLEWRRVMCETNITPEVITRVQQALQASGHHPGPIDGVIGAQTTAAIKAYQKQKGLAVGGLTYETLKSLGIQPAAAGSV